MSIKIINEDTDYLIKSFSSDKKQVAPFSLHNEAADKERPPCVLEVAGSAKNRLFSLVVDELMIHRLSE